MEELCVVVSRRDEIDAENRCCNSRFRRYAHLFIETTRECALFLVEKGGGSEVGRRLRLLCR